MASLFILASGCGSNEPSQQAVQQNSELEKLRAESQETQKLRNENKELARLRQDHQELQKLRGFAQELPTLRQENQQLRAQAAAIPQLRGQIPPEVGASIAAQGVRPGGGQRVNALGQVVDEPEAESTNAVAITNTVLLTEADIPQEGDEIFIEAKFLSKLLPEFNWEALDRKEPIAVKELLEQHGITLTNYQDLVARGVTNYLIQRQLKPGDPAQPKR